MKTSDIMVLTACTALLHICIFVVLATGVWDRSLKKPSYRECFVNIVAIYEGGQGECCSLYWKSASDNADEELRLNIETLRKLTESHTARITLSPGIGPERPYGEKGEIQIARERRPRE